MTINRPELDWLLGMYEMEVALEFMLQKAEHANIPFSRMEFHVRDFIDMQDEWNQQRLVGFCNLCQRGLMESVYPHSYFRPTEGFIQLLRQRRKCFSDLPDPPGIGDIAAELIKPLGS